MSRRSSEINCKPHELDLLKDENECDEESSSLIRHGSFNAIPPCLVDLSKEHTDKPEIKGKKINFGSMSVQSCRDYVSDSEKEPSMKRRKTIAHLKEVKRRLGNKIAEFKTIPIIE